MNKNKHKLPIKLLKLVEPILVNDEKISCVFHESFNWDITRTWAVLTSYRLLIVNSLPWKVDIQDYHLKDMNLDSRPSRRA